MVSEVVNLTIYLSELEKNVKNVYFCYDSLLKRHFRYIFYVTIPELSITLSEWKNGSFQTKK